MNDENIGDFQNSELFTLTYGAMVSQLMRDYENVEDVNKQLERMGYNIGIRLIEDFLAKTGSGRCYDFKDTAEKIQVLRENGYARPDTYRSLPFAQKQIKTSKLFKKLKVITAGLGWYEESSLRMYQNLVHVSSSTFI